MLHRFLWEYKFTTTFCPLYTKLAVVCLFILVVFIFSSFIFFSVPLSSSSRSRLVIFFAIVIEMRGNCYEGGDQELDYFYWPNSLDHTYTSSISFFFNFFSFYYTISVYILARCPLIEFKLFSNIFYCFFLKWLFVY